MVANQSRPGFVWSSAANDWVPIAGVLDVNRSYDFNAASTIGGNTIINNTMPISGFRNFIINGDFRINQRNGTNQVVDPVSASKYVTDRWACYRSSFATGARYQTVSVDTSLLPNVSLNAARVGRVNTTTGTGVITFRQPIEIDNIGHTAGQVMTISFYARAGAGFSSASSVLSSELYEDIVAVSPGGAATSPKSTIQSNTLTTSWQRFTHTVTRDATKPYVNGIAFTYTPVGTATSTDHFEITGVQLELGSVATPFENRPIGTELALCQRYYQKITPSNTVSLAFGHVQSTVTERFTVPIPVSLRTLPALTATGTFTSVGNGGGFTLSSLSVLELEPNCVIISGTSATAHTIGALIMYGVSGNVLAFDSEL